MEDNLVRGVIDTIESQIAVVLVGDDKEPWDFPLSIVPHGASTDTVLILERTPTSLRIVDVDVAHEFRRTHPFDARVQRASRKHRELRQATFR